MSAAGALVRGGEAERRLAVRTVPLLLASCLAACVVERVVEPEPADPLGGEALYRACTPTHHHHLICRSCGRTVELEAAAVERWAGQVAATHGFVEPEHVVDIFGLCAVCAAAR